MSNTSMTTREFYTAVIEGKVTDEVVAKASELIAALDARNEKRKSTESKEKRESAARRAQVLDFLSAHVGEVFTRDAIAAEVGLAPSQVTGACTMLAKDGAIVKSNVKVDKATKVGYSVTE